MGKHTPGPWTWGENFNGLFGTGPDNRILSYADYEGMWLTYSRDREANARLIAAAPETAAERDRLKEINEELLKALMQAAEALSHCKAAPGYSSMQTRAAININSAITKATGGNQ